MNKILKRVGIALLVIVSLCGLLVAANWSIVQRMVVTLRLYEPEHMGRYFRTLDKHLHSSVIEVGDYIWQFAEKPRELPAYYWYEGEQKSICDFIDQTQTTGLIVSDGEHILHEAYFHGNSADSRVITWSVSKSVLSALVGIAVEDGAIASLEDTVKVYCPELVGTAYENVSVRDLLQMSSGVYFNEDYADLRSDVNRMGLQFFGLNRPLSKFIGTLKSDREPGQFNRYVSTDTQVLGMVLRAATGTSITQYTEERLWGPLGMASSGSWLVDSEGVEATFGGLSMTLGDMMRFGVFYLNKGAQEKKQIVPVDWVIASITPDADHLLPGDNPLSDWVMGYGYQWWIPEGDEGEFMAMGIYGQAIYINPTRNIVIAKTSTHFEYDEFGEEMELESVEFFRTIAREYGFTLSVEGQ